MQKVLLLETLMGYTYSLDANLSNEGKIKKLRSPKKNIKISKRKTEDALAYEII